MISRVLDVSVKGVFVLAQRFAPLLERAASSRDRAKIIITTSVLGFAANAVGEHAVFAYSAAKAAAFHLARNLAIELAPRGILTNTIAPGFSQTGMAKEFIDSMGDVAEMSKGIAEPKAWRTQRYCGHRFISGK